MRFMPKMKPSSDIAVIGLSCYYPGASNPKELWENILSRRVQFRRMLDQRLPLGDYYDLDPKASEKTYVTKAAFIENFKFDWQKLRIPKKTYESTDIVHWLALDTALHAFEDAGYKLNQIPLQNTGVIIGNTLTGEQTRSQTLRLRWPFVKKALHNTMTELKYDSSQKSELSSEMEKIYKSAFHPITEDSLAGGLSNTIAGRICNYLNLNGGGYVVDGACSSSLLAVATAANALKFKDLDLVLAGGVDVSLDPFELVGFARAGALAKDKMSVYDKEASGFLPGEGCGFVLLKRLEDALRDRNYIYAVIKGWGISSDGRGGIMEPSATGQAIAIQRAYKNTPYKMSDIQFVEGHGTGTVRGDRAELEGIATAFAKSAPNTKDRMCGVTSFKSIVGHTKAAAGIGGLIKAVMAVNQRILPPTASCLEPNEVFKDKAKNLYPILKGEILPKKDTVRAGVSSAGFGGINCHITLESKDEPSPKIKPSMDENSLFTSNQKTEIFVFAARTVGYLRAIIQKFKEDLRYVSVAEMADLAALLDKKAKSRLPIKGAIVTDSPEHLYEALCLAEKDLAENDLPEGEARRITTPYPNTYIVVGNTVKKPKIGFLYPGQGSQRLNMTRRVFDRHKWAKDLINLSKITLYDYIYKPTNQFLDEEALKDAESRLSQTQITQPGVVYSSLIWTEYLAKLGIEPQAVSGHSLGELSAFYKAGAFKASRLLELARLRGNLMAANNKSLGSMASLSCSLNIAKQLTKQVGGTLVIANINGPNQIVVSGSKREIDKIIDLAQKKEISVRRLNVSNAFHSSFMKEASRKLLTTSLLKRSFKPLEPILYSCMDGQIIKGSVNLGKYFSKQVITEVNFVELVESLSKKCDLLIEVGPGKILTDLVSSITKKNPILCLPVESSPQNDKDLNIILAELFIRNIPINWDELYSGRLIRPFVPASRKQFIGNQCESLISAVEDEVVLTASTRQVPPQDNQKPAESLTSSPSTNGDKDFIANLLIDLTQKATGFERDSLSLELRLLDDLNLDSIKAGELIAEASKILGVTGQLEPSQLANSTLIELRDRFKALVQNIGQAEDSKPLSSQVFKRYQNHSWVRNFILEMNPEELKSLNSSRLKESKNILLVTQNQKDELPLSIKKMLLSQHSKVEIVSFDAITSKNLNPFKDKNCLIFLLPHPKERRSLSLVNLKKIFQEMHALVDLVTQDGVVREKTVAFIQLGEGDFSGYTRALASTLHLERPDLRIRIIDFDSRALVNGMAQKILDELQTKDLYSISGYDRGLKRKVPVFQKSDPITYKSRNLQWSSKDVVLVTGGAKGITAKCALEFGKHTKARMILVGRSPTPTNPKDKENEIIQTLHEFKNQNIPCEYHSCDITNKENVNALIQKIQKKHGEITGIIHGAGLNHLRRLKQAALEEIYEESLPKAAGMIHILDSIRENPPKLIMAMTSVIGVTGMPGSGWYGFANELLHLTLKQFNAEHPKTQIQCVAYSVWDEVGMGVRLGSLPHLQEKGIGAIPIQEGVSRFGKLIKFDPGTDQVIVVARIAGLDTWRSPALKNSSKFRFIEDIKYSMPGVELIAEAHLNIQDDSYLLDHDWKGSLLFPFVFGLEAMTQAAAYVTNREGFDSLRITNIQLERPIPVNRDTGITIEIHAEVLELDKANGTTHVQVEIFSEQTNFKEPHFQAVFELDPTLHQKSKPDDLQLKSKEVIDLDMQTDVYGPVLFQGKSFQCIERVHRLYYDKETKKGECLSTVAYQKSAKEFLKINNKFGNRFLIKDPFFMDSLLQSMQLIIPQDLSLPRTIQSIELKLNKNETNLALPAHSKIMRLDADHYRGDARVRIGQDFFLNIENCRLKILDTILTKPSANDLVYPGDRDQRILNDALSDLSGQLNLLSPILKCAWNNQLTGAKKDLRHKIELPLIQDALKELTGTKISKGTYQIKWLKSGKPIVSAKGAKDICVSVSHTGSFLLIAVGKGDQGCDVEVIQHKSNEDWKALLGPEKYSLMKELTEKTGDIDFAGTAVWGASETLQKYSDGKMSNLNVESIHGNVIIFSSNQLGALRIVTTWLQLTRGGRRAVSVMSKQVVNKETNTIDNEGNLKRFGYKSSDFQIEADYKDKLIFKKRFPIVFRHSQTVSRRVNFTSFFSWMGEVREYGIYPILKKLADIVETGEWGVATNHSRLEIFGDLRAADILQCIINVEDIIGEKRATYDLVFEWWKQVSGQPDKLVAVSHQRFSWVKVLGHGFARVETMPAEISKFMQAMFSSTTEKKAYDSERKKLGKMIASVSLSELWKNKLEERIFETSLEDSNLVGNIYFANYSKWMGIVKDLYFYKLDPSCFHGTGESGELDVISCNINHINEAMPFNNIKVEMFLKSTYEYGIELYFEFFKISDISEPIRLATADLVTIWKRVIGKNMTIEKLPQKYYSLPVFERDKSKGIVVDTVLVKAPQQKLVGLDKGKNSQDNSSSQTLLQKVGYNPEAFQLKLDYSGPQNQLVFIKSQPITFKTNKLQSKKVYFTSYFDWMGDIREQSANPIMEHLAGKFQSGNWGIATYSTKLEIFGELSASDILESHFWSEEVPSNIKGTYDLCIDWKKISPDQKKERVAFSRQRILWVKIIAWGLAQPEKMPDYVKTFMDTMRPRVKEKRPLEALPQVYSKLNPGKVLLSCNNATRGDYFLSEITINTTLEHSNLVGNIYFANYSKWIGQLFDSYFYRLIPEHYSGTAENGEFVCLKCEINHLSEAMPFNDVSVKMYLEKICENGISLIFDFYLIKNNEKIRKLAFAKYETAWVKRTLDGQIFSLSLPDKIINTFLQTKK